MILLWTLFGFAIWTLLVVALTVGVHRWSAILTRRANFATFAEYKIEGPPWYRRSLRAHANCVENLPVFAVIVVVAHLTGTDLRSLDGLAIAFLALRVAHTTVHVAFEQTNGVTAVRSGLFISQWICMVVMCGVLARHLVSTESEQRNPASQLGSPRGAGTSGLAFVTLAAEPH